MPGRLAGEDADDRERDEADADGVTDGPGDGHGNQHEGDWYDLFEILEVDMLEPGEHEYADVDQSRGGCGRG